MIIKVNSQEFDSSKMPIVITFIDNDEMKNIGQTLCSIHNANKTIMAYKNKVEIICTFEIKASDLK
jgi:hypothetical protein